MIGNHWSWKKIFFTFFKKKTSKSQNKLKINLKEGLFHSQNKLMKIIKIKYTISFLK